jgi:hypothetical protein
VVSVWGVDCVVDLGDFFLGDSLVFFGDFGDFGDLGFFGDSFFGDLVDLAFAALAFFGDVDFLGLDDVVVFLVGDEVTFFVVVFLTVFLGDLGDDFLGTIDVFFELEVDLFLGDEGAVVEVPDVA